MPATVRSDPKHFSGSSVYKYRSLKTVEERSWVEQTLTEHTLFFPKMSELNDPEEALPSVEVEGPDRQIEYIFSSYFTENFMRFDGLQLASDLKAIVKHVKSDPTLAPRALISGLHKRFGSYRCYSMSSRPNILPMWAEYADNHHGICYEFSTHSVPFSQGYTVRYGPVVNIRPSDPESRSAEFLFVKRAEWSWQEEVRILLLRGSSPNTIFDPHLLTRVILGKDMSRDDRHWIAQLLARREVPVALAYCGFDSFHRGLRITSQDPQEAK